MREPSQLLALHPLRFCIAPLNYRLCVLCLPPAASPFRQGILFSSPMSAADSINVSNCGFSEELSRKVLSSLKALTESIGGVRESVAKIDRLAQTGGGPGSSPSAVVKLSLPPPGGSDSAPLTALSASSSDFTALALSGGPQRPTEMEAVLRKVCLSAAATGTCSSWDDHTWEQLRHVLDASSYAKLQAARVATTPARVVSHEPGLDRSDSLSDPEDTPLHVAMAQDLDEFTRDDAGVDDVIAAPPPPPPAAASRPSVDAVAAPMPSATRPYDPMAGDADWPGVKDEGPIFVAFNLRVVYEAGRTGFEEVRDFQAPVGALIAGR